MKTPAARRATLEQARTRAAAVLDDPTADQQTVRDAITSLRVLIDSISNEDAALLAQDRALQSLVIDVRSLVRSLQHKIDVVRAPPSAPPKGRSTIEELSLRRCAQCDSNVLYVLRDARMVIRGEATLPMTAVVCGYCGSTRLYAADLGALRRAGLQDAERVELPVGEGPFRRE
ncbi:MAG: hypothetical protein JNK05_39775 [Myxococcales bacterium]|nr:hypothetical protein [Myxococcales bacterium]